MKIIPHCMNISCHKSCLKTCFERGDCPVAITVNYKDLRCTRVPRLKVTVVNFVTHLDFTTMVYAWMASKKETLRGF